jgi:hypothetical protein
MNAYHVVLYVHLLSLLVAAGASAVMFVCHVRLRAAHTRGDAQQWLVLTEQTVRAFPLAVLGLFGTGAYLTSDLWSWRTGWIDVSIAGLVFIALQGPLVGGRAGRILRHALEANGPGVLAGDARRAARSRATWIVVFSNPAVMLAIVWNMTDKPSAGLAAVAVVVAFAVGAGAGLRVAAGGVVPDAGAVTVESS